MTAEIQELQAIHMSVQTAELNMIGFSCEETLTLSCSLMNIGRGICSVTIKPSISIVPRHRGSLDIEIRAAQWGVANASFDTPEALDEALAITCQRIASNSSEAVAAMKDLYRLAENEDGITASLNNELASTYEISDTAQKLSHF